MRQSNIKIAVTGGIGSGKSTVCNILKESGFPVFSCDEVYADLLNGGVLSAAIAGEFGDSVLTDGKVDRRKLSKCVFNDKDKLEKLNKITHGKIFEELFSRAEGKSGLVFFEVPLLFEGGYQNLFDGVIVVLRGIEERISSVSVRDNLSLEEIEKRINNQYIYDNNSFAQYYAIHNSGKIDDLCGIIRDLLLKIANDFAS